MNAEKIGLGCLVILGVILAAAFIMTLSIAILAGLAMLVCNVILPMFDINYIITFWQGCGIGVIVSVLRACFSSNITVKKS